MILKELLTKANLLHVDILDKNILNVFIDEITTNSKEIKNNNLFVALEGANTSGAFYIKNALNLGASAVVANSMHLDFLKAHLTFNELKKVILVPDSKVILKELCKVFYSNLPQNIIAITGTNGKTSVVSMLGQLLSRLNIANIQIGTLGVYTNGIQKSFQKTLTTPVMDSLYSTLNKAKNNHIDYAAIETSSEGIAQQRLIKNTIDIAAFTNLSRDHLNFHKTLNNYFKAKCELFLYYLKEGGIAVVNKDDEYGKKLISLCQDHNIKVLSYGKTGENLKLIRLNLENSGYNIEFSYNSILYKTRLNILGEFQVYNFLCALLILFSLNVAPIHTLINLSQDISASKGRLELVAVHKGAKIFIDYAHTPEALELVLKTLRNLNPNNLYVLFGCGGNRDITKRSLMGTIASKLADFSYITDDNPRNENPQDIRTEIIKGFKHKENYLYIPNRKEAITAAINALKENEILVIAGKGHEEEQILNNKTIPFKEKDIIYEIINKQN